MRAQYFLQALRITQTRQLTTQGQALFRTGFFELKLHYLTSTSRSHSASHGERYLVSCSAPLNDGIIWRTRAAWSNGGRRKAHSMAEARLLLIRCSGVIHRARPSVSRISALIFCSIFLVARGTRTSGRGTASASHTLL